MVSRRRWASCCPAALTSVVAALAVRASSETVKTFSISFARSFDESPYARAVAKFLGTDHHEERFSASLAANLASEIGAWMDEPISDPSLVPTFLLSRFTRKHVTVALGGDGGDEIFAGYPMYFGHHMARAYNRVPKFLRRGLIEPVVNHLPVKTSNLSFDYRAKRFITASHYDEVARHHVWFGSFTPSDHDLLLSEDVRRASEPDIYRDARRLFAECDSNNLTECMQSLDTQLYLAEDILTKVDRASMAVSLEVRAPYLDPRVAEFAAGLPSRYKLHGYTSKYILKRAAGEGLVPVIWRRGKKGFGVPFAQWLKGEFNVYIYCLMPDHFHGLIGPGASGQSLGSICGAFKSLSTREYWSWGEGKLWQRQFFDHIIRNQQDFEETVEYIRLNPVRRGLVENPGEWPYTARLDYLK